MLSDIFFLTIIHNDDKIYEKKTKGKSPKKNLPQMTTSPGTGTRL